MPTRFSTTRHAQESHTVRLEQAPSRNSWGRALELAFILNVILAGGIVAFLWALSTSNPPANDTFALQTIGALLAAAVLEVGVGTLLAVVLLFVRKTRGVYYSTLSIHVAEIAFLGLILIMGTNAFDQFRWN